MDLLYKISNWYFSKKALPYWCILCIDSAIVMVCGYITHYSTVGGNVFAGTFWPFTYGMLILLVCYFIAFRVMRTYRGIIRFSSFVDLGRVATACVIGASIALLLTFGLKLTHCTFQHVLFPKWIEQLCIMISATLIMWMERIMVKMLYDTARKSANSQRAFIYGVADGGVSLAKSLRNQSLATYDLRGFISPEKNHPDMLVGLKVYADNDKLPKILKERGIAVVFVSPLQNEHFRERTELIDELIHMGIKIMMYPSDAEQWDGKSKLQHTAMRDVDIEDLLPRDKIEVDLDAIANLLRDQVVMVTGAAGSIGYEMVRQVAKFHPQHLLLIDQAETPMHTVRLHMAKHYPHIPCETIVTSITNATYMEILFRKYRPSYVFHAAAYKHVPMMEDNPAEAVQNNIYGTRVIADLAVRFGTKKFVMISTDKAVNPTNVMGCSKRICEIYCQSLNQAIQKLQNGGQQAEGCPLLQDDGSLPVTQFITTRFGNVLGSNGSVIPIFKKQIAQGGPLTVTHPDIIRYFMLIPEACRLVLEAGTMGNGGEIFVFDMGKPVRIADLAQRMIDLSGVEGLRIEYTGLRDGEKLFEELLNNAEQTKPTVHPKIMVASVREYDYELARRNEEELLQLSYTYDDMRIVQKMKQIVPEYKSQNSKYASLD